MSNRALDCRWNTIASTCIITAMGMTTYSESTCFHEAGHAVVAAALGLEVHSIHIHKDNGGGHTNVPSGPVSQLPLVDQAAICFAGLEATIICNLLPEKPTEACDWNKFYKLVRDNDLSDENRDKLETAGF